MEDPRELVVQLNLYILQTISQLARNDIVDAMLRFEISREIAEGISNLNTASLYEIAKCPTFLFSIDQKGIMEAVKDREQGHGFRSMQSSIKSISALIRAGGDDNA